MRLRVLVAHESAEIRDSVVRLTEEAGFTTGVAADGERALELLLATEPHVLLVDVALPKILGFELVQRMQDRRLGTRTILIASVYNKMGYKRRPTSLYGADDYIEQHHLVDELLGKIRRLVPAEPAPRIGPPDPEKGAEIRRAGEGRLTFRYTTREDGLLRARRLARLIVSDVVLYNAKALEEDLDAGDLEARLGPDLEEGRLLFDLRVPAELRSTTDFIADALREFVKTR